MASLDSIRLVRDALKNQRIFIFIILALCCAAWSYMWLKNVNIIVQLFVMAVILINIWGLYSYTRQIQTVDDFLVFHALKVISSKGCGRYGELIKFPKNLGIKRADVERMKAQMKKPNAWLIEDNQKEYFLIYDKKLEERFYGNTPK